MGEENGFSLALAGCKGEVIREGLADVCSRFPLSRKALAKLRLKAIRRGVWFRELKSGERKLLDLTIGVVERVRSRLLAEVLKSILNKLCAAMESRVVRLTREIGRPLARSLSAVAQRWGNGSAAGWAEDPGFIRYLVIGYVNAG